MKAHWENLEQRWLGFSMRERGLLLATAIILPLLGIYVSFLEPDLIKLQKVQKEIKNAQRSNADQELILHTLESKGVPDPNSQVRKELDALQQRLLRVNHEVSVLSRDLVSPEEMLGLLNSVLDTRQGLRVLSAKSLEVELLTLDLKAADEQPIKETAPAAAPSQVYLHPFEMELEGSYKQLYRYLQRLEALHQGFFWDELEFVIEEHPVAKVRLKVYTLSTDERWLGA